MARKELDEIFRQKLDELQDLDSGGMFSEIEKVMRDIANKKRQGAPALPKKKRNVSSQPRDEKGRFLPKSALGDFAERNNAGKERGVFQEPSPLATQNIGNLGKVVDPVVFLAVLRNQQVYLQKLLEQAQDTNALFKKDTEEEIRQQKETNKNEKETKNEIKNARGALDLIRYGLLEMDPVLKENEKYTQYATVLLEKILNKLADEERAIRLIPFQLNRLHDDSKTCCKSSREGGGGGGLSLLKLLGAAAGGYGAYRGIKALRNRLTGPRGMPPTEPSEPFEELFEEARPFEVEPYTYEGEIIPPRRIQQAPPEPEYTPPEIEVPYQGLDKPKLGGIGYEKPAPESEFKMEIRPPKEVVPRTYEGEIIPPKRDIVPADPIAGSLESPAIEHVPDNKGIPETPKLPGQKALGQASDKIAGFLIKQGIRKALNFIPGANILSRILEPNQNIMTSEMERELLRQGNAEHAINPMELKLSEPPPIKPIEAPPPGSALVGPSAALSPTNSKVEVANAAKKRVGVPYVGEFAPQGMSSSFGVTTNKPYGEGFASNELMQGQGQVRVGQSYGHLPTVNVQGVGGSKHSPQEAIEFFKKKGWTTEQASALASNLQRESGLNPAVVNSTGHAGVAQWDQRRQAMFAQRYGKPVTQGSFEEQLDFVDWELNNTEKAAGDRLKASKTAAEAGQVVGMSYERFGNHPFENSARMNLAESFAKQYTDLKAKQNNSSSNIQQAQEAKSSAEMQAKAAQQAPVIVNAPTTVTAPQNNQQIAGPMPRTRTDDPVILQAIREDVLFS